MRNKFRKTSDFGGEIFCRKTPHDVSKALFSHVHQTAFPSWSATIIIPQRLDGAIKMSAIGPQLPSSVADRQERRSRYGSASGSSRSSLASSPRSSSPSGSDRSNQQRTRPAVAGPQLPEGFIRTRSDSASYSGSDAASSDDDQGPSVGPALPTSSTPRDDGLSQGTKLFLEREARKKAAEQEARLAAEKEASSRPEWMLLPPSLSNASSLQAIAGDPLNLKSRGFAQTTPRVSARGGANTEEADTSLWTETPEERLRRVQDEVSGVKAKDVPAISDQEALERERSARRDSGIAAAVAGERSGKKSLLEEHNERRRRELKAKKLEDEDREASRTDKRRRHDDGKDDATRSSRHRYSDGGHRTRRRSRSRSPEAKDKHRHGKSSSSSSSHRHHHRKFRPDDDSHRSHASSRHKSRTDDFDEEGRRRSGRRKTKESDRHSSRNKDKDDRKSTSPTKSRKEREEEDVRSGKAAAPMIWDRDAALSVGGRLMDEKKRGKIMADANALGDRFGSGSRRFL